MNGIERENHHIWDVCHRRKFMSGHGVRVILRGCANSATNHVCCDLCCFICHYAHYRVRPSKPSSPPKTRTPHDTERMEVSGPWASVGVYGGVGVEAVGPNWHDWQSKPPEENSPTAFDRWHRIQTRSIGAAAGCGDTAMGTRALGLRTKPRAQYGPSHA